MFYAKSCSSWLQISDIILGTGLMLWSRVISWDIWHMRDLDILSWRLPHTTSPHSSSRLRCSSSTHTLLWHAVVSWDLSYQVTRDYFGSINYRNLSTTLPIRSLKHTVLLVYIWWSHAGSRLLNITWADSKIRVKPTFQSPRTPRRSQWRARACAWCWWRSSPPCTCWSCCCTSHDCTPHPCKESPLLPPPPCPDCSPSPAPWHAWQLCSRCTELTRSCELSPEHSASPLLMMMSPLPWEEWWWCWVPHSSSCNVNCLKISWQNYLTHKTLKLHWSYLCIWWFVMLVSVRQMFQSHITLNCLVLSTGDTWHVATVSSISSEPLTQICFISSLR